MTNANGSKSTYGMNVDPIISLQKEESGYLLIVRKECPVG